MWEKAEKALLKDKYIGPLVKKYGKCKIRPIDQKDYFKDLVDAIVQQQLSLKAAATIFGRITKELGGKVTPERILRKKDETLRACGLSYSKIKYLKDLSSRVSAKSRSSSGRKKGEYLDLFKLDKLSDEKVMEELIKVKGIGRWTAEMFLMFALARPDIFPADDMGLQNAFKKLVSAKGRSSSGRKRNLKPEKMAKFAERWKPFRTVASWYIWASLENK